VGARRSAQIPGYDRLYLEAILPVHRGRRFAYAQRGFDWQSAIHAGSQFFIAFPQSWTGAIRPEAAQELVTTDPHQPAEYRTIATIANSRQFQAAFGIPDSSPMVNAERCVIW
jgi:putative endopeptidase